MVITTVVRVVIDRLGVQTGGHRAGGHFDESDLETGVTMALSEREGIQDLLRRLDGPDVSGGQSLVASMRRRYQNQLATLSTRSDSGIGRSIEIRPATGTAKRTPTVTSVADKSPAEARVRRLGLVR